MKRKINNRLYHGKDKRIVTKNTTPRKEVNLNTLEAKTLLQNFAYPIVLVTFKGEKEIAEVRYDTYDLHTPNEIIQKNKIVIAYMKIDQTALTEGMRVDKNIKRKRLQTRIPIKERPDLHIERTLKETLGREVTATMMNGQVIAGKLTEYDEYNLLVNINDMPLLLYRHAIYQFQDVRQIPLYTYRKGKDIDNFIQKVLKGIVHTTQNQLTLCYKGIGENEAEQITQKLQAHIPNVKIEERYI